MNLDEDIGWVCKRLIYHEGIRLMPYICPAGKWTIGVGRNFIDNPLTPEELRACPDYKHGITYNGAMFLLRNDIHRCYKELKENYKWFSSLDKERQYALIDMCFQLGLKGLQGFKKMLLAFARGNYELAAYHCLDSKYAKRDTPQRAKRIAYLIKTGKWYEKLQDIHLQTGHGKDKS